MADKKNTPEISKESEQKRREMESLTKELAKKMTRMNVSRTKKSRFSFLKVNPIVILSIIVIASFLFAGLVSQSSSNESVSLSELIDGLKENNYSQLQIQDDGSVVARGNEYFVTEESVNFDADKATEYSEESSNLKNNANFGDIESLFDKKDVVSQIRSIFGRSKDTVSEILYGENYVLVVTEDKTYMLNEITKTDFEKELANRDIDLEKLGIETKELRIFAESLDADSISKRIEQDQVANIFQFNDVSIAELKPESVKNYSVDWTPSIFTFADVLQNEGFSLSSANQNFEVVTLNVPGDLITLDLILTLLTIGGFVFLGFVIFRSAQASGMGVMQFGQSKAKMFFGKKTDVTFKDVAGIDEAREELNEIVEFLRNPGKFTKLGARIPKGILMFGPPGTGKTLLARAIAGEAGVPFFHTSGSEFEEMLVGAGASRVRDLFAKAKKAAPALIFIDEIDAVARKRGTRIQSGTTEQTLNQILVEMDGFEKNTNVIVIAATNRPDVLDDAILRPGRFDRQVRIEAPDKEGREEILKIHSKNKPLAKDVDLGTIAKRTVGFTGADLENIMNEAAIITAKDNRKELTTADIDDAVSKVVLGPAKKSRKRTDDELNLVAYHEAGHALVAKFTDKSIPVDKISIVSRGMTGGVTMFIPEKDENIISMNRLLADIRVSLGGRAAEEVVLGDISTGASNDIEKATRVARSMIQKYGMSKDLGMVQYGQSRDSEYLGYHYGQDRDFSEDTAEHIDKEVREIISREYQEALRIVKEKRDKLDILAKMLREKEVLEKDEFNKIFE